MRKALLVLGLLVGSLTATNTINAQDIQIREASIALGKVSQSGLVADFNYSEEALETVLEKRFSDAKMKSKKDTKKFRKIEGATWAAISQDKMDYYYRISGKNGKSTLELLASKGYDNFVTSQSDATVVQNLQNFINSLESDLVKYSLNELIEAKQKEIKSAEKTLESKKDNVKSAEKELEDAKAEVNKQEEAVNTLKGELDTLKAQQ